MKPTSANDRKQHLGQALILMLLFIQGAAQAAPFVFTTPHITDSVIKQVAVDDAGSVVVAGYRFFEQNQIQRRVVLYRILSDGTLAWLLDNGQWNQVFDVVFSDDSIWLLHRTGDVGFENRQISRYDRFTGAWQWTVPTLDRAHVLVHNPTTHHLAVGSNLNDLTHTWWHDQSGAMIQSWSADFVPSQGPFDAGAERTDGLALLDDDSVILLVVLPDSITIKLHRVNFGGAQVYDFDWVPSGQIQQDPQLLMLNNEQAVFYFMDESGFGVPRPVQISVAANGQEVYNHSNNHPDTLFHGVMAYLADVSPDGTRVHNFINSTEDDRPFQYFELNASGTLTQQFEQTAPADWPLMNAQQILINDQQSLMFIARGSLPFPELGSNTHYLVWDMAGNVCDQRVVTSTDSGAHRVQFNGFVHELVDRDVDNGSEIHLLQGPTWDAQCKPIDLIFADDFSSS